MSIRYKPRSWLNSSDYHSLSNYVIWANWIRLWFDWKFSAIWVLEQNLIYLWLCQHEITEKSFLKPTRFNWTQTTRRTELRWSSLAKSNLSIFALKVSSISLWRAMSVANINITIPCSTTTHLKTTAKRKRNCHFSRTLDFYALQSNGFAVYRRTLVSWIKAGKKGVSYQDWRCWFTDPW